MLAACFHHALHFRFETLVEVLHPFGPLGLSLGDIIKLLLYIGRKVIVHDVREVGHQEVVYHDSDIGREKLALLRASLFLLGLLGNHDTLQRIYGVGTLLALLVALHNVFTLLDGADGRSIGRWTANAESSSFFTRLASVYLAGARENFSVAMISRRCNSSPFFMAGRRWLNLLRSHPHR